MTTPNNSFSVPSREQLEVLVREWTGKRYPAYHCADDLRFLLDKGRMPGGFPPVENAPSTAHVGSPE